MNRGASTKKGNKHFKEDNFILLDHEGVSSFRGKLLPWKVTIQNNSVSKRYHV